MKKSSYKKVRMCQIVHFIQCIRSLIKINWNFFLLLTVVQVSAGHAGAAQPRAFEGTNQGSWEHCGGGLEKWGVSQKNLNIPTFDPPTIIIIPIDDVFPLSGPWPLTQAPLLPSSGGGRSERVCDRDRRIRDPILPSWDHNPVFCLCSDRASLFGCKQEVYVVFLPDTNSQWVFQACLGNLEC